MLKGMESSSRLQLFKYFLAFLEGVGSVMFVTSDSHPSHNLNVGV